MAPPPIGQTPPSIIQGPRHQNGSRLPPAVLYAYQWAVLLLVCPPLLVLDFVAALPLAALLVLTGAVEYGRRLAAVRDPVLAKALEVDVRDQNALLSALSAFGRVYTSLAMFGFHRIMCLFVYLAQPRTVFVVYTNDYKLMRKFFCVGTGELISRYGFSPGSMHPEEPWVFMMGLIHVGPDVGFGVYGSLLPALSHLTPQHLEQLPAAVTAAFPSAESIALAGRLPGIMTAAGVPLKAPFVDGLSGTVFAMEATIRALVERLPAERRANPTVAILGGAGYIGSRLVSVLATRPPNVSAGGFAGVSAAAKRSAGRAGSLLEPQSSFSLEVEPETAASDLKKSGLMSGLSAPQHPHARAFGMTATVTLRDKEPTVTVFKQIIALDTRYENKRHAKAGVLYTAEARDLETADVVLVITRNGDDVAGYVQHAQAGQEWGDDTHPEIGRALLQQLTARGVNMHKAMATRNPPTALVPPLPGWPLAGTPGCLLMALVSAATHRDWNGAGTGLAGGHTATEDAYWDFSAATRCLGFHAMLTSHRRSKVDSPE